jgi:adenosylcobyric acid synthase
MNPLLVKVKDRNSCEVIALGRSIGDYASCSFSRDVRPRALEIITESLDRLRAEHDLLVIEGDGSPAEINLNKLDVSNMQVARLAASPVLLVADIDPGGALAAVVGTLALLNHAERKLIRGIIINKFRGDRELLEPGLTMLEKRTGKRVVGVLPWFDCSYLAEEDTLHETGWRGAEVVHFELQRL